MEQSVRVEEYTFGTAEQRRSMAESVQEQLAAGATVVGIVPVGFHTDDDGVALTSRVAVLYLGGDEPLVAGVSVATATMTSEEPAPSIIEEILHIPEPESPH